MTRAERDRLKAQALTEEARQRKFLKAHNDMHQPTPAMTEPTIEAAVREDIRCHRENGVDLNPFSTNRARTSWQNGFDGLPEAMLDWHNEYRRGQLASQLIKEPAKGTGD